MATKSRQDLADWFTNPSPEEINRRRYETLRSVFVDRLTHAQAAAKHGYSPWTVTNMVRDFKNGKLDAMFCPNPTPGPKKGTAPAKDRARARAIELRREGLSTYEISARLAEQGTPLNRTSVGQILREEGFGRLLRHPGPESSTNPATPGRDTHLPPARVLATHDRVPEGPTRHAGLLLAVPAIQALDLASAAKTARYPSTAAIPATNMLAGLLALKLVGARRVSHVDDFLADPAVALFAGMAHLPKKSALTAYSYATHRDNQDAFLAALAAKMRTEHLTGEHGVFNLDFHSIMHWGHDPVLEKNYVPTRSQRARSVLAFLAEDAETGNLVYADATVLKTIQSRQPVAFCDHQKHATGQDPHLLVMDQKVTTGQVLGELDARGVKFITLRMRSAALVHALTQAPATNWRAITLDRPGRLRPKVLEDPAATIRGYPGTLRQLAVTGLGHDQPTIIITNDHTSTPRQIVNTYAHRMGIEQRLAEIIQAFSADALSSTVNLNVDLDLALCVWAQAATAHLANTLPGYHGKTPDTIQRRFLETPGHITQDDAGNITVHLDQRAYTPTLRQAHLPQNTPIDWWGGRTLSYQLT
jgi:transposase